MYPGQSMRETTGSPKASHSCRKRAALSDSGAVDGFSGEPGVVGDDADGTVLDSRQGSDHLAGKARL